MLSVIRINSDITGFISFVRVPCLLRSKSKTALLEALLYYSIKIFWKLQFFGHVMRKEEMEELSNVMRYINLRYLLTYLLTCLLREK